MVILKVILITVLLTLIAVAALSIKLFFTKNGKLSQATCQPQYASETSEGGGCGCGGCGCGGGGGHK